MTDSVVSCSAAGAWMRWATDGMTMAATETSSITVMPRARELSRVCVPCLRPPTTKHSPSTRSRFARIEPMRAAWTTATRPALSANSEMNSSGRLPSADCRTPVAPGPNRSPSCSTDRPTRAASRATAAAAAANASSAPPPA